jgi:hypothetical protein
VTAVAHAPQEWHEVTSPPTRLALAAERMVARYGTEVLGPDALGDLVSAIALRAEIWTPLTICDPDRRRYRLLFEDDRLDIWVLSWMPGQATGFHDHGSSAVALTAVQGAVLERQIRLGDASIERALAPGAMQLGAAGYIHSVTHLAGLPAVTVHAYSPPLVQVGQYRSGPSGELLREQQHGRQELLDRTLGS